MDFQILNDSVLFTQIGISVYGLAALLSASLYLKRQLGEWDLGMVYLILLVASSVIITLSFKEQIGGSDFFINGRQKEDRPDDRFAWIYVLSLLTNIWLMLALKYIRPDQKSAAGRLLRRINWNWPVGVYTVFAVLAFSLASTVKPDWRSFLDVYASGISVMLFCTFTGAILWFRQGKGFALLMAVDGVMLALAQGFLYGKIYPDSPLRHCVPGSGLSAQAGISLYIIGRAGLIMSILNLSQTWLKIRLEEKNTTPAPANARNELKLELHNNDLALRIKMKNWEDFCEISGIESNPVRMDIVRIAAATKRREPLRHESGVNYSRMRKNILNALNTRLPAGRQLVDADLFGGKTKETVFKFDPDAIDLPTAVSEFFS